MKIFKIFDKINLNKHILLAVIVLVFLISVYCRKKHTKSSRYLATTDRRMRKFCIQYNQTLKAKHKTCFLRPDTGPCRADIIQWYYDVRQSKCYRFFWGGCQGNGNRFETKDQCWEYCYLDIDHANAQIPHFCSLTFSYGDCFGYFNRWAWDYMSKTCKRHLYSGCGGNQNNFQTYQECVDTCLKPPNNTLSRSHSFTTCIPAIHIPEVQ